MFSCFCFSLLDSSQSSNSASIPDTKINSPLPQSNVQIDEQLFSNFLKKLGLQAFHETLKNNHILSILDLEPLTEENLKELKLPIGARNRIINHFKR